MIFEHRDIIMVLVKLRYVMNPDFLRKDESKMINRRDFIKSVCAGGTIALMGCGTAGLFKGKKSQKPNVLVIMVDDLGLPVLDSIILDVEGFEYYAVRGATNTIDEFRPLILFEDRGELSPEFYNEKRDAVIQFLTKWGYKQVADIKSDKIFIHRKEFKNWD